ncbi:MAG: transcriptional regulator, partial [Verrucomicrobiae bacterium]|nr:transcriptional regulator [Verrucomicrobiae bacterium]
HEMLSRFFSLLEIDEATQRRDIEGIEHHLSPATVAVMADLARFLEENPGVLERFRESRRLNRRRNAA